MKEGNLHQVGEDFGMPVLFGQWVCLIFLGNHYRTI